jgi:hypothetical protein
MSAVKSLGRMGFLFLLALGGLAAFGALTMGISALGLASGDLAGAIACTALVVGGFAGLVIWAKVARAAFGEAHLEVLAPVHEGGTLELMLVLEPKRTLVVSPADCVLRLTAVNQSGESAVSLFMEEQPLQLPATLERRLEHRVVLPVPGKLPITVADITASVTVTIGLQGWPDLVLTRKLEVLPRKRG